MLSRLATPWSIGVLCVAVALTGVGTVATRQGSDASAPSTSAAVTAYRGEASRILEALYDEVQPVLTALTLLERPRPGEERTAAPFFEVAAAGQVLPAVRRLRSDVQSLSAPPELSAADAAFKKAVDRLSASLGPVLAAPSKPEPGDVLNSVQNAMEVALVDLDGAVTEIYRGAARPAVPSSAIAQLGGGRPAVSRSAVVVRASQVCDDLSRGLDKAEEIDPDYEDPKSLRAAGKAVAEAAAALAEVPVPEADRDRLRPGTTDLMPLVQLPMTLSEYLDAVGRGSTPSPAVLAAFERAPALLTAGSKSLGSYGSTTCRRELARAAL